LLSFQPQKPPTPHGIDRHVDNHSASQLITASRRGTCISTLNTCFWMVSTTNLIITYSILNPLWPLPALEDLGGLCTTRLTKIQPNIVTT